MLDGRWVIPYDIFAVHSSAEKTDEIGHALGTASRWLQYLIDHNWRLPCSLRTSRVPKNLQPGLLTPSIHAWKHAKACRSYRMNKISHVHSTFSCNIQSQYRPVSYPRTGKVDAAADGKETAHFSHLSRPCKILTCKAVLTYNWSWVLLHDPSYLV